MPVYLRNDLPRLWKELRVGNQPAVFLIVGERFLARQVTDELVSVLVPDERLRTQSITAVDGDQEEPERTLNALRTYSLFAGRKIFRVMDTRLFISKWTAKSLWDKAVKAAGDDRKRDAARLLGQMIGLALPADASAVDELLNLSPQRWEELFGFARPQDFDWIQDIPMDALSNSTMVDISGAAGLYAEAIEEGWPAENTLILVTEEADKRSRLYKVIKEKGVLVDLAVDTGFSRAARQEQDSLLQEIVERTLSEHGKKMGTDVIKELLDRVGFHPVAVMMETEKLALYVADAPTITRADLDAMVARTREDALFEFNEAVTSRNLSRALAIMGRIRESGTHMLMLVAGLRNHIRRLLAIRAIEELEPPRYSHGMQYYNFEKNYLPELKKNRPDDPNLGGHAYALFMLFQRAEKYDIGELQDILAALLEADFRLKGAGLPEELVMEQVIFRSLPTRSMSGSRNK